MSTLIPVAAAYLDRYEAKKQAKGLEFSAPPDKAELGELVFPADVLTSILTGVVTGVLTRSLIYAVTLPFQKGQPPADTIDGILARMRESTDVIQLGIEKLKDQGVNAEEAKVALELLLEAIREVLSEQVKQSPPPAAPTA